MEFKSKSVHSYFEKNADCVSDPGETSAKYLLVAFEIDIIVAAVF